MMNVHGFVPVFFSGQKEHFFRPLTWEDRECCAATLRSLHDRIHGPNADYSEALTRELVVDIVLRLLGQSEYRTGALSSVKGISAEEERAYALSLLRTLKEYGWIEDHKDPIDLRPTLKLTRAGKEFAEVFSSLDNSRTKTRQRNMRSAKKSLAAFLDTKDEDELLDGYDYATRVVQDLQEDIEYFRGLMQSLTREALEQKVAWGEFNEFLEKRFSKEMSVRLVADSVERHRGHIVEMLDQIRSLPQETRNMVDLSILQRASWVEDQLQGRSPTHWLCDRIEMMVDAACELKLPMLRTEMHNYVRRFTSLLRQALSLDYGSESALGRAMSLMKDGPEEDRADFLDLLTSRLSCAEVRLHSGSIRWSQRIREEEERTEDELLINDESRLDAAMRRAEAQAFIISETEMLATLNARANGSTIRLSELVSQDASAVLTTMHAVGAARSQDGKKLFSATRLPQTFETDYFTATDYELTPLPLSSNEQADLT
ncbi:Wadjet anti-phage system protein JetA family protein [Variovorax paradoxus]|uniref:Wadjet anti-phage system protein JetA family protein n=1 Tax=Variovorax paradoxus TaxID=34073 RepID=UPI003D658D83